MLIVLEGCDGCGKTTLAQNLAVVLKADIIHCTNRTQNNYSYFAEIIAQGATRNIIADRFMYGQFVYQTEAERKANDWLTSEELHSLERMMYATKAKLIHVTAPPYVIKERLRERNETVINGLSVDEVVHRFQKLLNGAQTTSVDLDTSNVDWRIGL